MNYELTKLNGCSFSLAESPCVNLCGNVFVGGETQCKVCGRTEEQIYHWEQYPETTRRLINLDLYDTHTPRQKITALAEEYNIPFSTARQIFAEDGYHQKPN